MCDHEPLLMPLEVRSGFNPLTGKFEEFRPPGFQVASIEGITPSVEGVVFLLCKRCRGIFYMTTEELRELYESRGSELGE